MIGVDALIAYANANLKCRMDDAINRLEKRIAGQVRALLLV